MHLLFIFVILLLVLSQESIENSLSTSLEVVVWSAYTLPSPDPTRWEYTWYVVVVVAVKLINYNSKLKEILT